MQSTDYDLMRFVFLGPIGNSYGFRALLDVGNEELQDRVREVVIGSAVKTCSRL
jgi:hypothetical protein